MAPGRTRFQGSRLVPPWLCWESGDDMKLFAAKNATSREAKGSKLFVVFVFLAMVGFYVVNRLAGFRAGFRRKPQSARGSSVLKIES